MSENPSLCVFCGSSRGSAPEFGAAAREVGRILAGRCIDLVYGGGRVGLMGVLADAALEAGGRVIGVIPRALATKEVAHDALTELHVVAGMHERKALMAARSSAFLTLPGGIGTFEEFFEIVSWGTLGIHRKPVGILNVAGYFDPLFELLEHGIRAQFIGRDFLQLLLRGDQPGPLIADLVADRPPPSGTRWMKLDQS